MKTLTSIFNIILLALLFVSCSDDNEKKQQILFIELMNEKDGELLSGPTPSLQQLDFPTYSYDTQTRTLKGIIDFEVNKHTKIIFGSGACLSGMAGNGCATGLGSIEAVPHEANMFEVLKLDDEGNIILLYKDNVVKLKPGEGWIDTKTYNDTIIDGTNKSIVEITNTDRVSNFGFLTTDDILEWEWN